MKKTRKIAALFLSLIMVFSLSACQSAPQPDPTGSDSGISSKPDTEKTADKKVTINLWHLYIEESNPLKVVTDQVCDEYMAAHPNVKIEQHILQDEAFKTKMLTEFSGDAKSIDVFAYWGAGRAGDLVRAGKLLNLEDYLSAEQVSSIKQGADSNFRYDGKLYGLPLASWVKVLYCNSELFEMHNVKYPETYDEWLDACKKFADAGVIPIAQGIKESWLAAFVYEALALREVGGIEEMKMLNGEIGFDDAGFARAAEKCIEMNKAGAFGKSPLEIDEPTANATFLSGAAAMTLTGSWFTSNVYHDEDSTIQGKVKPLLIPLISDGKSSAKEYSGGFIDGYFVNKATENPEISAELAYLLSTAIAKQMHESGEGFTAWNLPVDESTLTDLGKEVAALADTLEYGVIAWDTFLPGDIADIHLNAVQTLFSANPDVEKVIQEHQDALNK